MNEPVLARVIQTVQKGVRWLRNHAEELNDSRDISITISALIAAERNPHSNLIQRLVTTLLKKQTSNGSWNDEIWDTTWALMGLHSAGSTSDTPAIESGLRFIEATQDPFSRTWYEEPFETMMVIFVAALIENDRVLHASKHALSWILSQQKDDGCIVGIRYTGMAASLLLLLKKKYRIDYKNAIARTLDYIRSDITNKPIWTGAAWSNYYPLKALLDSGARLEDPAVTKAIDWFIKAQDHDGKWMQVSKIHDTAMSILVLSDMLMIPIIYIADPKIGVLNALKENGTIRMSFRSPNAGAITPAERIKISDEVRIDLSKNQNIIALELAKTRGAVKPEAALNRINMIKPFMTNLSLLVAMHMVTLFLLEFNTHLKFRLPIIFSSKWMKGLSIFRGSLYTTEQISCVFVMRLVVNCYQI